MGFGEILTAYAGKLGPLGLSNEYGFAVPVFELTVNVPYNVGVVTQLLNETYEWDNYFYTRQWNVPFDMRVIVMPPTTGEPGGAGEFGVPSSMAAVACAYARATGTMPTKFPINHDTLSFDPYPTEPPLPPSPMNGLKYAY